MTLPRTLGLAVAVAGAVCGAGAAAPETETALRAGTREVRVVCFGDSITGVYYHTGGVRAWPKLLELALREVYPRARLRVFNAGVSGNTTDAALKRIQRDVLARKPGLVVVMFGMNDLAYGSVDAAVDAARKQRFRDNLESIVTQCRAGGAEVILLTPNSTYPESAPGRPPQRIAEFAAIVRGVGDHLDVPVVDAYAEWERIRRESPRQWRLLMSETIHPCLRGHRVFAELTASAIHGAPKSLADLGPYRPCLSHTRSAVTAGTVHVVAPAMVAAGVRDALRAVGESATVHVVQWTAVGQSLAETEHWARTVRGLKKKTLVIGAFSPDAAEIGADEEAFVRRAAWIASYTLPFGKRAWDVVFVSPAVFSPRMTVAQERGATLLKRVVEGHDLVWIDRPDGDVSSPAAVIRRWIERELEAERASSGK